MIQVIDINAKPRTADGSGHVRTILSPQHDGTRVEVAFREVAPGQTAEVITRRGSPAREVRGFRKCSFR